MEKFVIIGGKPLRGEIEVRGSKNAATPILAATLLTEEPCIIDNLPLIEDVFRMLEILESMGVKVKWLTERKVEVRAENIELEKINEKLVCQLRSSVLLLGPLLARFGKVKIPHPGGCIIGARPVDAHFEAFKKLGVRIKEDSKHYYFESAGLKSNEEIILKEFSVTATENILMAASLIPGKTIIKIAASEPHVQDLIDFLVKMGVEIQGRGTHTLEIKGTKGLKGVKHKLIPDPIEAGTFLILGAATRGKIEVKGARADHLDLVLEKLKEFGVHLEIRSLREKDLSSIIVRRSPKLKALSKIQALPYPGIPTDLEAPFGVLATQAEGTSLMHDPLFEGRMKYIDELIKMGANAVICDPHRALITGPTPLYGQEIRSFDLRAGATLIIAALIAKGESIIYDAYQVDRGYERIEERLSKLGADIKRAED